MGQYKIVRNTLLSNNIVVDLLAVSGIMIGLFGTTLIHPGLFLIGIGYLFTVFSKMYYNTICNKALYKHFQSRNLAQKNPIGNIMEDKESDEIIKTPQSGHYL